MPSGKRTRERMWFIIGIGGGTAILVLVLSFSIWRCIMKKTKDDVKNPEAANKGSSLPAFSSYSVLSLHLHLCDHLMPCANPLMGEIKSM